MFKGDSMIKEGDKSKVFDVDEEVSGDMEGREFYSISLSCGGNEDDSWRYFFIEFEKKVDYQAFCQLLSKAEDIEIGKG